jgi:hypothetical protein
MMTLHIRVIVPAEETISVTARISDS